MDMLSNRVIFSPYFPAIGSFWPVCLVHRFSIAGEHYEKCMLYAELVSIDYKRGTCKVQYWHDENCEIAGGLVEERIGELPAIAGEIDTSYRGSFSRTDFKSLQSYDDFESVTNDESLAADFESVTEGKCRVCGNDCSPRAKTCSSKCRKRLSRDLLSHG